MNGKKYFIIGIITAIFLKLFVVDLVKISGNSMEPALKDGNLAIVFKLAYGIPQPFGDKLLIQWKTPKENDVVIYLYNNNMVVKRCVAREHTPLEISSNTEYSIIVGEKTIPLNDEQYEKIRYSKKVPEDRIMAVGDNYSQSVDSRNYGFIATNNILGKVLCK